MYYILFRYARSIERNIYFFTGKMKHIYTKLPRKSTPLSNNIKSIHIWIKTVLRIFCIISWYIFTKKKLLTMLPYVIFQSLYFAFVETSLLYDTSYNVYLNETSIKVFETISLQMCVAKCSDLWGCMSVNFWRHDLSCNLTSTNHLLSASLIESDGSTYVHLTQVRSAKMILICFIITTWFHRSICNGYGMPAGNVYPSGHLVPSVFGICLCFFYWHQFS